MQSDLRTAIEQGNLDAVCNALSAGADIEEADMHGLPGLPLRLACFRGHAGIVEELLHRGANIDAPNGAGSGGPLRMAVRGNHPHIVDLLLTRGAKVPEDLALSHRLESDRRERRDRRQQDAGPPAEFRERRRERDRRTTHVHELSLDDGQWKRYFANPATEARPPRHEESFDETASMILGRVRN